MITPALKFHGAPTQGGSQRFGSAEGAVGDEKFHQSTRMQAPRDVFARLTRTEQKGTAGGKVAEVRGGKAGRGRTDGNGPATDLGLTAHLLGRPEGVLEKPVEHRGSMAGTKGGCIGVFDLAEDLGLAEHHGIEAGRDAEKMMHRA